MRSGLAVALGVALAASLNMGAANAQSPDASGATCRSRSCSLIFDWGPGRTAGFWGPDRRYGSGEDFEARFRGAMGEKGLHVKDAPDGGPVVITLRPNMRIQALCDMIAATRPDRTCTAMSAIAVNFFSSDSTVKAPSALRIGNRCGSSDTFMTMNVFAGHVVDLIYYALEGQAKKEPRPQSHC